eukprot:TRINITY_DN37267_c0_g1_i2.p1 TRINITY_DN37267_c0_g1~~TRINITY_DN37267_c0_g1_i2.p1  ORF type:complete len:280 (-),score=79.38 TRINITY_DN37267_c0_g1_i2:80-919(-)
MCIRDRTPTPPDNSCPWTKLFSSSPKRDPRLVQADLELAAGTVESSPGASPTRTETQATCPEEREITVQMVEAGKMEAVHEQARAEVAQGVLGFPEHLGARVLQVFWGLDVKSEGRLSKEKVQGLDTGGGLFGGLGTDRHGDVRVEQLVSFFAKLLEAGGEGKVVEMLELLEFQASYLYSIQRLQPRAPSPPRRHPELLEGIPEVVQTKLLSVFWMFAQEDTGKLLKQELQCLNGLYNRLEADGSGLAAVSYTHLRAHETPEHLVCRLLLEKKKKKKEQ